jgi:hypothetical protein
MEKLIENCDYSTYYAVEMCGNLLLVIPLIAVKVMIFTLILGYISV